MSDTVVDTGVEAKQRGRRRNQTPTPEETLAQFRCENPQATVVEMREIARQYILENTEFEDARARLFTMWFVDDSLPRRIREPAPDLTERQKQRIEAQAKRQEAVEAIKAADEERIEAIVQIRLLDYQTTYGKALGDCTGAECERLSRRYGDFFSELAKRLTRSETVRAHMTEVELQAIARTYRLVGEKAVR